MKKALICIAITLGSIVLVAGIVVALFFTGTIPENWAQKVYSAIICSDYYTSVDAPTVSANTLEEKKQDIYAPDEMIGLYVDADEEYTLSSFSGAADFCNKVESDFITAQSVYMNTCFYEPYSDESPLLLKKDDGGAFNADEYIASLCRSYSLELILVFDSDYISDSLGAYSFSAADTLIKTLKPDGVMFSDRLLYKDGDWLTPARRFASDIAASCPELYFGVEVWNAARQNEDGATVYSSEALQILVDASLVDFIYIEAYNAIHDLSLPFGTVYAWWDNYAANYPDIMFYCEHRNDRVCTDSVSWNVYNEISNQLKVLWECLNFNGSSFYSSTAVARNESTSTQRISVHYTEGYENYMHVDTISVNRENFTVTFTGSASPYYKLTLNGEPLDKLTYSSEKFNLTLDLIPGMNSFSFEQCGRNFTYRVYSHLELTESFYPSQDVVLSEGEGVSVTAVCPSSCTAFCMLGNEKYEMVKDDTIIPDTGVPDGYSVFSRTLSVRGAGYEEVLIGAPVIIVSLDGTTEEHVCGKIKLAASPQLSEQEFGSFLNYLATFLKSSVIDETSQQSAVSTQPVVLEQPDKTETEKEISPFTDYGLGEELVCRIRYENVEKLSVPDEYDTYHPDLSTLTSGTLDYVTGMSVSETGYIRYKLESGVSVYAIFCELMCGSYRMPQNNLNVLSCESDIDGFTRIKLDSDWLVPVNISLHPLNYSVGYLLGSFNVSEFNPQYIDVRFSYTGGLEGFDKLTFANSSILNSAQVIEDGDTFILRLILREPGSFCGYEIDTDELGNFVLSFRNKSGQSVEGKVIMLDPGHGSLAMTGTANSGNDIVEKDIDLQIAFKVRDMLKEMGATVLLTRESDIPLSLGDRMDIAEDAEPDIFVSLHCDGSDYPNENGTHTFYYSSFSMPLAQSIHNSLVETYKTKIYYSPQYETQYNKVDKKIKFYPFQVTRISICPSVLVEMGFLTNTIEWQVLADTDCQYWLARAISDGISNYFINY